MSICFYLTCHEHGEYCDGASTAGEGCPQGDSAKILPAFLIRHKDCRLHVVDGGKDEIMSQYQKFTPRSRSLACPLVVPPERDRRDPYSDVTPGEGTSDGPGLDRRLRTAANCLDFHARRAYPSRNQLPLKQSRWKDPTDWSKPCEERLDEVRQIWANICHQDGDEPEDYEVALHEPKADPPANIAQRRKKPSGR